MKLAEALILRADTQKRIEQIKHRLINNAKVQEGEEPSENPEELLIELDRLLNELTNLVKNINKTNSSTVFEEGKLLTDALAERDTIILKRNALASLVSEASVRQDRYSRSEVKFLSTVDVAKIQKEVDNLSKEYRELDSKIQQKNWIVDLKQ